MRLTFRICFTAFWLLLWRLDSSTSTTKNILVFAAEDPDNVNSMLDIQNKLLKIQSDIILVSTMNTSVDNLEDLTNRLGKVEVEYQRLKETLAAVRSENTKTNETIDISLALLNNHYNAVNGQLKSLQPTQILKEQIENENLLPTEAIQAIKDGDYTSAEYKIIEMKNNEEISKIIKTVYANSSDNFDIILDFAKGLTKIDPSYYVLQALRDEMLINDHRDPYKIITLVKTMETEVAKQPDVGSNIKIMAETVIDDTLEVIKYILTDTLKAAVGKGKFESNGPVDRLINAALSFRPNMTKDAMASIINETYGEVPAKKILDYITSHKSFDLIIKGIQTLFRNIKDAGNLNTDVTLKIASYLRQLRLDKNYSRISQKKQDTIDEVIKNLPTCARNLFFLPTICLWNRAKEEFLYAATSAYNYDSQRRQVFLGDPVAASSWYAEAIGNNFFFKNHEQTNEYLYAAALDFNKDLRYVLTWIPGGNTDEQSAWSIELDGDYCYLKSVVFNEYLFASGLIRPGSMDMRYAFTWKPGTSVRRTEFQWQVRSC